MTRGLMLLMLAALLLGACADPNASQYRGRDSMIDMANRCAVCGATVEDNYFAGSSFKAIGPGNY